MFESGTYKSLHEHVALYEALEASMERANKDEFFAEKDNSRKRRRDDQDPPPPPNSDPIEDVSMPNTTHISDSEDTNSAYLPKIKPRPEWLKPILEENRPATQEPDWVIPLNKLPEPENNWANAFASSYQIPKEYKLL
ncbi:hypothetical protein Tco_0628021 [Tanacetum coccineum]|uniref:Uncharacterized protein n=1 Tax=Tanacetum coccineum TaxID=301880 RepID=A0ABQ4WP51_9ASTR